MGPLGHPACHGLLVHTTLAITPERLPLGLLAQQVWARDPDEVGKRARRKQLPITRRKVRSGSTVWRPSSPLGTVVPNTRFVSVGDREADVYDVLAAERPVGVEMLIRAAWDRCVDGPQRYVWATVAAQPVVTEIVVHVPRRGPQPARQATLSLRYSALTLCPPRHRSARACPPLRCGRCWCVKSSPRPGGAH